MYSTLNFIHSNKDKLLVYSPQLLVQSKKSYTAHGAPGDMLGRKVREWVGNPLKVVVTVRRPIQTFFIEKYEPYRQKIKWATP